jgi:hypothetical protein
MVVKPRKAGPSEKYKYLRNQRGYLHQTELGVKATWISSTPLRTGTALESFFTACPREKA